ncbi:MAG: TOBE domain-containing protein [Calditrichaeota bacterium]|nr:TOBE domain-containing protein [Calditrichota bacterium]
MKYGAQNKIMARVTDVKVGDIMSQVKLEVNDRALMSSVMTTDSLQDLGIQPGDHVKVVVKAIHVLIVKE